MDDEEEERSPRRESVERGETISPAEPGAIG